MALGPIHCGSFLLLAACVLLVVATISVPVVSRISFLNIRNAGQVTSFGVFGYCRNVATAANGLCSSRSLGYDIAGITGTVASRTFVNGTAETVTKTLILHPIAAGIAFFSFLIALCSDRLGFIFASLIAFLAFLASLAALVIDFVLFGIIKREINNNRGQGVSASWGNAIWMTLAATIVLFFAQFAVLFACCGSRRRSRRDKEGMYAPDGYVGNQPMMSEPGYQTGPWYRRGRGKYAY